MLLLLQLFQRTSHNCVGWATTNSWFQIPPGLSVMRQYDSFNALTGLNTCKHIHSLHHFHFPQMITSSLHHHPQPLILLSHFFIVNIPPGLLNFKRKKKKKERPSGSNSLTISVVSCTLPPPPISSEDVFRSLLEAKLPNYASPPEP